MRTIFPVAAVVVLSTMISTQAGAVALSEPPDLPNHIDFTGSPPPSTLLDLGLNTVTGSLDAECLFAGDCTFGPDPSDVFQFSLPTGSILTAAFIEITNISGPIGFNSDFTIFGDGGVGSLVDTFISTAGTYGKTFSPGLGPNVYAAQLAGFSAADDGSYSVDYQMKFTVSAVPLPPTALLLGSGLLLGGLLRRRHRTPGPVTPA